MQVINNSVVYNSNRDAVRIKKIQGDSNDSKFENKMKDDESDFEEYDEDNSELEYDEDNSETGYGGYDDDSELEY
jgi:hypothetical protein